MRELSKPAVAVITRTKDRPLMLDRAIRSVLAQTFEDYVVVIVNDGGSHNTVEDIVSKYQKALKNRIKVIHNKKALGMEAASNTGIKQSSSKYIAMLDDDDTWHHDFLKETVGFLENNPEFKGVVTIAEQVTEILSNDKIKVIDRIKFSPHTKILTLFAVVGSNQFTNNSFVYSREALREVGYYNEKLPVLGDWDFNIRFLQRYDIGYIDKQLAYYHRRQAKGDATDNTKDATHSKYRSIILNDSLRNDLESGKFGVGTISNISYYLHNNVIELKSSEQEQEKKGKELTEQHVRNLTAIIENQKKELEDIKNSKAWKLVQSLTNPRGRK